MNFIKKFLYKNVIPLVGKFCVRKNKIINVIYYHDVVKSHGDSYMRIELDKFKEQMRYLVDHGYKTFTFQELDSVDTLKYNKKNILITFDDGWLSNYTEIFEFMKERGLKYNIFLAAGSINNDPEYLTWDMITEMHKSGICGFGAHTYDHVVMNNLDTIDMQRQIQETNALVEAHIGYKPKDFCFPKGVYTTQTLQTMLETTPYTRLYTSDMDYSYVVAEKIVFGRNAISNEESNNIFINKVRGYYNVFQSISGRKNR